MGLVEPFHHQKMVEAPEHHTGKAPLLLELVATEAKRPGRQAKEPAGLQQLFGIGAIAVDTTGLAQLAQLNDPAEIGQDRGQGCRTTFGGFVLQTGAHIDPLLHQALHELASPAAAGTSGGANPNQRFRLGSTSSIGRTRRVVISTSRRSPGVGANGRSERELQR